MKLGIQRKPAATIAMWKLTPPSVPPATQPPATISMWKLSRDPVPPARESPIITRIPARLPPITQRVRARFAGSGTKLRTEAMAPVSAKRAWPILAIALALVGVVILAIALRG